MSDDLSFLFSRPPRMSPGGNQLLISYLLSPIPLSLSPAYLQAEPLTSQLFLLLSRFSRLALSCGWQQVAFGTLAVTTAVMLEVHKGGDADSSSGSN